MREPPNWDCRSSSRRENLILTDAAGSGSLAEVIARTDDALLITSLWYLRDVDPQTMLVTGLTRDGCYGIREGRLWGRPGTSASTTPR